MNITVYTRDGCGCCDRALELLRDRKYQHIFTITVIDIDGDAALKARYGSTVPVVVIGGVERFKGVVNPVLLDRLLES